VTFTAYDQCGHTISHQATVTIVDTTPPVLEDDALRLREDTPQYLYVLENDADACDGNLTIVAIARAPSFGTAVIMGGGEFIRYAPFQDYRGPDAFDYTVSDCSGNEATASVTLEVVPKLVMPDGFHAIDGCLGSEREIRLTVTDPLIKGPGDERLLTFAVLDPPAHGILFGPSMAQLVAPERVAIDYRYDAATGFHGTDAFTLLVRDPFGVFSVAEVTIEVTPCLGEALSEFVVAAGTVLDIIVPTAFVRVVERDWEGVGLERAPDGESVAIDEILEALWDEVAERYAVRLDTVPLGIGRYRLTLPIGNDQQVALILVIGEGS
jgi:hypothetical protein